ncbi:MAG: hypothetical protein ACRCZF_11885, partial [Gemmataceae bacterium]
MDEKFLAALGPLLARARIYLDAHPELRAEVVTAATALAAWASGEHSTASSAAVTPTPAPRPDVVAIPANFHIPLHYSSEADPHTPGPIRPLPEPIPLADIITHCRLKAECCTHIASLSPRRAGVKVDDQRSLFYERAKQLTNCYIWMFDTDDYPPRVWQDLASAYSAVGTAAELLQAWQTAVPETQTRLASDVLHLVAETQAVLYAAVADVGRPKPDFDQVALYRIIRDEAHERSVYITRYMRKEDQADPASAPRLLTKLTELLHEIRPGGGGPLAPASPEKRREKHFKNLQYKLMKLKQSPHEEAGEWPRILEIIDELVMVDGLAPSDAELRDLLLPVLSFVPDDQLSLGATRVMRFLDT